MVEYLFPTRGVSASFLIYNVLKRFVLKGYLFLVDSIETFYLKFSTPEM